MTQRLAQEIVPRGTVEIALRHLYRPVMLGLTVVILTLGMASLVAIYAGRSWPVADDSGIYVEALRRVLSGGEWYLPQQMAGPYLIAHGDVLHPPVFAWFMLPWLVLPLWTVVAIPVVILVAFVLWCRPAPWAWPVLALCLAFPWTSIWVAWGNPVLWCAVFVAAGLRWHWPGALILLKPSLFPFALIGIRHRSWWVTVCALAILSLPFVTETLAYPRIVLDKQQTSGLLYSILQAPLMFIPLVAWTARRTARTARGAVVVAPTGTGVPSEPS